MFERAFAFLREENVRGVTVYRGAMLTLEFSEESEKARRLLAYLDEMLPPAHTVSRPAEINEKKSDYYFYARPKATP